MSRMVHQILCDRLLETWDKRLCSLCLRFFPSPTGTEELASIQTANIDFGRSAGVCFELAFVPFSWWAGIAPRSNDDRQ